MTNQKQNTSPAVMAQRREALESLDDFPTPPWATRAILCWLIENFGYQFRGMSVREPCCNRGHMVKPLLEYFDNRDLIATDIHDYGCGFFVSDYLTESSTRPFDFTVMNPPFNLGEQFITRAIETSRVGVVAILRTSFLEGVGRYERLFKLHPPTAVVHHSERVVMLRSRLIRAGAKYTDWDAKNNCLVTKTASTATSYSWFVWLKDQPRQPVGWIEPGVRAMLERDGDYPPSDLNYLTSDAFKHMGFGNV